MESNRGRETNLQEAKCTQGETKGCNLNYFPINMSGKRGEIII